MKYILIVDDDRDVFESMKIVLEAEGYRVDWATNGSEALQKVKAAKPDLMILDVMMNSDDEGFQVEDAMWHKHLQGRARGFQRARGSRRQVSIASGSRPLCFWSGEIPRKTDPVQGVDR